MLVERRQETSDSIRAQLTGVREECVCELSTSVLDEGHPGDFDAGTDIELVLLLVKLETLTRIDEATSRLNRGLYGWCIECGAEIPALRLRSLRLPCGATSASAVRRRGDRSGVPAGTTVHDVG